jgi:hypothetical protein
MIIHDVEQRSDEWYALRAGMPTASEFSKLVTSKGEPSKSAVGYAVTLAGELFAGKPLDAWEGNQWSERGKEMEGEAIAHYEFMTDQDVEAVGFVTDDDAIYGCSPDGIVGVGGVEIKCLKAETHIKTILYFQKNGRCPTDYVQQTQGQIMICDWEWCDLIFYHPELPQLTIRQEPDCEIQAAINDQIAFVCRERDKVFAAIKQQDGGARELSELPPLAQDIDLNAENPVF